MQPQIQCHTTEEFHKFKIFLRKKRDESIVNITARHVRIIAIIITSCVRPFGLFRLLATSYVGSLNFLPLDFYAIIREGIVLFPL